MKITQQVTGGTVTTTTYETTVKRISSDGKVTVTKNKQVSKNKAGSGSASQSSDGASTSGISSTGTYTKKKHVSKNGQETSVKSSEKAKSPTQITPTITITREGTFSKDERDRETRVQSLDRGRSPKTVTKTTVVKSRDVKNGQSSVVRSLDRGSDSKKTFIESVLRDKKLTKNAAEIIFYESGKSSSSASSSTKVRAKNITAKDLSEIKKVVGSDRAIVPSVASGSTLEKISGGRSSFEISESASNQYTRSLSAATKILTSSIENFQSFERGGNRRDTYVVSGSKDTALSSAENGSERSVTTIERGGQFRSTFNSSSERSSRTFIDDQESTVRSIERGGALRNTISVTRERYTPRAQRYKLRSSDIRRSPGSDTETFTITERKDARRALSLEREGSSTNTRTFTKNKKTTKSPSPSREWQTPGPADITISSSFGSNKSAGFSFGGRYAERSKFLSPGPGSYDVTDCTKIERGSFKSRSFSGRHKDKREFVTPSPGDYTPEKGERAVRSKSPAFSFGGKGKEHKQEYLPVSSELPRR